MIGVFFAAENSDFSFVNVNSYFIRFQKANFGSISHLIEFLIEILMEFKEFFSEVNFIFNNDFLGKNNNFIYFFRELLTYQHTKKAL